jgi:hypothetical protein
MLRTMRNQATNALRVLAEKYLRLAKTTADPRERNKFFNYAAVYADLSARSERHRNDRRC